MTVAGKQIAVLGAGESGVAAARLAKAHGAEVTVYDTGDAARLEPARERLAAEGISLVAGEAALSPEPGTDLAVVSPGIDLKWPIAKNFSDSGVKVIAEIEFAFLFCDAPVIAITGTNGKTTTTELVARILNHAGQSTVPTGNYGRAFSDVIRASEKHDAYTLEVSSFQLEGIRTFRPAISVWMNFAPDHMDRYETVDDYRDAKLRIFENQQEGDAAVVNTADPPKGTPETTLTFSAFEEGGNFTYCDGIISFNGTAVLDFKSTRLRGRHNVENLMAAMGVAHLRGISFESVAEAVREYTPPPHRCELVDTIGGCAFINDSKATNLHALESSLRGQEESVVLIAGGKDKGLDFGEIVQVVADKVTHVVAIGQMAGHIREAWGAAVPCEMAATLDEAVVSAARAANPGQTVLFSPGTSSFDMFANYGERGAAFREAVKKMGTQRHEQQ